MVFLWFSIEKNHMAPPLPPSRLRQGREHRGFVAGAKVQGQFGGQQLQQLLTSERRHTTTGNDDAMEPWEMIDVDMFDVAIENDHRNSGFSH